MGGPEPVCAARVVSPVRGVWRQEAYMSLFMEIKPLVEYWKKSWVCLQVLFCRFITEALGARGSERNNGRSRGPYIYNHIEFLALIPLFSL